MDKWILIDTAAFLTVSAFAGLIIPQILLIAFRKQLFDSIDPRKIHQGAVPRLGGISFFPTILFAMLLMFGVCREFAPELLEEINPSTFTMLCFVGSAIVTLYLVGIADDLVGIKYRAKFIAQILCACLIVTGGISLTNLHGFCGLHDIPHAPAVLFTILLTVFITNAINLIDGIDGLASGLSAIVFAFYGYIFFNTGLHVYALLSFSTLGALLPFFYYNVFGNVERHKKIFMGDTGALTIGLIISVCSIRICMIPGDLPFSLPGMSPDPAHGMNPAVVAFAPLLIPCLDVVRVYFRRIRSHRNPFLPDKTHIHHKLLALGMSQKLAMPVIVAAGVVLTVANYCLCTIVPITVLFIADLILWTIANILLSRAINRRQPAPDPA